MQKQRKYKSHGYDRSLVLEPSGINPSGFVYIAVEQGVDIKGVQLSASQAKDLAAQLIALAGEGGDVTGVDFTAKAA